MAHLMETIENPRNKQYLDNMYVKQYVNPYVEYKNDRLSVIYQKQGMVLLDVASVQADKTVPEDVLLFYFEVKVVTLGTGSDVVIGFT